MKLSEKTFKILQNFTGINMSLSFKEGRKVRTISPMQNVYAEAEIEEYIPKDFAVYDSGKGVHIFGLVYALDRITLRRSL